MLSWLRRDRAGVKNREEQNASAVLLRRGHYDFTIRNIRLLCWFYRSRVAFVPIFSYCPILLSGKHRVHCGSNRGSKYKRTVRKWKPWRGPHQHQALAQGAAWAVMHWDTNSLLWLSRHHKQTIHLTWSHKWLWSTRGDGGRGGGHDHWALALWEEAPSLPSHLSTVKCVGKTFITSMALLRVNSHCNNNHHMRTYKKRAGLALALTLLPPLFRG